MRLPLRLKAPAWFPLPKTLRAAFAEALRAAEVEYREAQAALFRDDSNEARARYARVLAEHDKLSALFPFVADGAGDTEV